MPKTDTRAQIRRNELFEDVAETIANQLMKELEVPKEKAVDVGNVLADFLAKHWKGQSIYIPSNWHYKNRQRDQEIYDRMAVGNAGDLASEFGISEVRVYQIYSRIREEKRQ